MSEDRRVALIRKAFEDFEARRIDGLVGFLHPEIESHVAPSLLNSGTWKGIEGFVQMNAGWEESFGTIGYEILEIDLVDERNALIDVHQAGTGAGSGVPVELDVVFLIEFEGDQAVRFQIHATKDEARAAL